MKTWRIATGLLLLLMAGLVQAQGLMISRYVEGEHYLDARQPLEQPDDGKIHVTEFFLYSCPHCYHMEPDLNAWRETLGDDVVFSRVPVLFSAGGEPYARLYYTAEALGVLAKVHDKIFAAIHEQGRRLLSESAMRDFMVAQGVDGDRFSEIYESDEITAKLREAAQAMQAYPVTATPSITVAGRYYVTGRTAGSNDRMLEVADYLIAQQRARKP
ncbi:thiol:disulfide interchange protein DsbA [Salinisphaera sp. T5B8]|uniref:thiol:disulfide interchange protein DsbA/DsbL n=1 Tax=Salinisphaera sp. T5B8 TaxID=1304154 RepID=UPI00334292FB